MPLEIQTETKGIGDVLRLYRLRVPEHQRAFQWKQEEVGQLWDDIIRARAEEPGGYFIGPIVLDDSSDRATVIDGQQRLATFSLLFAAAAALFREKGDEERPGLLASNYLGETDLETLQREPKLILGEDDNEYFRSVVEAALGGGGTPEPAVRKPSQGLVKGAFEYLSTKLSLLSEAAGDAWDTELLDLLSYCRSSVEVILIVVGSDQNAYLIFETLNDRGLRLNTSDLLKNYLFGQAGNRLGEVKTAWTEMSTALAPIESDDSTPTFLRHYWISTKDSRDTVRAKNLYRVIRTGIRTVTTAVQLAQGLAKSAEKYAALTNPAHPDWRSATGIARSLRLLNIFRVTTSRPLLLAAAEVLSHRGFEEVLEAVSRWSIRLAISGGLGSGTIEEKYGEAARRVRNGEITAVPDLLRHMETALPNDEEFKSAFAIKTLRNRRQTRSLLAAMERTVRTEQGVRAELIPNLDEAEVNLEHVMPHNPETGAWDHVSADERVLYLERLGNMALMLLDENSDAGSEAFGRKKVYYQRSSLILTQGLSRYPHWDPQAISARQGELAEIAVRTWTL